MGIMEKKIEATTVYLGLYGDYIGVMGKKMNAFF